MPAVSRHPRGRGEGRGKRCSGGHQIEQVGIGDPGGLPGSRVREISRKPGRTKDVAVCPRLLVVFPRGGGKPQGGRPEKSAASGGTLSCAVCSRLLEVFPTDRSPSCKYRTVQVQWGCVNRPRHIFAANLKELACLRSTPTDAKARHRTIHVGVTVPTPTPEVHGVFARPPVTVERTRRRKRLAAAKEPSEPAGQSRGLPPCERGHLCQNACQTRAGDVSTQASLSG